MEGQIMKNILLISEQIIGNRNFIESLKTVYKVDAISYVSTALHRLRVVGNYDLVIIEIGMPNANSESLLNSRDGINFHKDHLEGFGVPTILWLWGTSMPEEIPDKVTMVLREHRDNHLLNAANNVLEQN